MNKFKLGLMGFILMVSGKVLAVRHQQIDTLGSSPKGQFVAIEEYGYRPDARAYYVTIKILNIWKNQYVGKPIHKEAPVGHSLKLDEFRKQVHFEAQSFLKSFNIISG